VRNETPPAGADGALLIISYEELSSHNGLNTRVRGIARALAATGRQVEIAAPSYGPRTPEPRAELAGIRVHAVHMPNPFSRWKIPIVTRVVSVALLTACVVRYFRKREERFAWVQSEQAYPFPASRILARKWGAKVILDDPALLGLFIEEKFRDRTLLRPLLKKSVEAFETALLRRADCILCSAERTAETIRTRIRGARTQVYRVSNGVDLEEYAAGSNGGPANGIFFNCSVPYYQNLAALQNLLRIFDHFERQAFHGYSAVVAVNDATAVPARIRNAFESNPRVRLLSNQKSLVPWLHSCDIVLLPYEKGHLTTAGPRLKVFEALACGKIVLGTPAGLDQIPGCIDGRNVIVCPDWLDMARKTMDLITEGETPRKQALRREARRFVEERHSWESLVRAYEPILGAAVCD
jgi:glycosyltransferase involved in cell wall biosynthesis